MTTPEPGWYDDPDGSGGERWWDGERWTTVRRIAEPSVVQPENEVLPLAAHPTIGAHKREILQKRRTVWIAGGIVFAVIMVIGLVVATKSNNGGPERISGGSASSGLSGSRDDWYAAICKEGTFLNGGPGDFPNATGNAFCQAGGNVPGVRGTPILIGEWDSDYAMRNDLSALQIQYYASASSGKMRLAFAPFGPMGYRVLEPLTRFGFTVNHLR